MPWQCPFLYNSSGESEYVINFSLILADFFKETRNSLLEMMILARNDYQKQSNSVKNALANYNYSVYDYQKNIDSINFDNNLNEISESLKNISWNLWQLRIDY